MDQLWSRPVAGSTEIVPKLIPPGKVVDSPKNEVSKTRSPDIPKPERFVVVSVPTSSFYAPGRSFVLTSADIEEGMP